MITAKVYESTIKTLPPVFFNIPAVCIIKCQLLVNFCQSQLGAPANPSPSYKCETCEFDAVEECVSGG